MKDVFFSGEDELAVFAMDLKLRALLIVVLADFLPRRQEFGAVLAEMVLQLMRVIITIHYYFLALLALDI